MAIVPSDSAPRGQGARTDSLTSVAWFGLPRARHMTGLTLAAALVFAAVATARTVPHRVPAPSTPGVVGWMSSHENEWASADQAVEVAVGDPAGTLTVRADNHWTRIDQPDRFDWGAAGGTGRRTTPCPFDHRATRRPPGAPASHRKEGR